jgi:hypothetical protein
MQEQLKTLEDLKIYLDKQYEDNWKNNEIEYVSEKCNEILSIYILTDDEYEYAMPIKAIFEEQSNKHTLINSKKALEILLKRK